MGQVLGVVLEPRGVPLMSEVSPYMAWHPRGGGAGCRRRFRPGKAGSDVESCACGGVWGRWMLVAAAMTMTGGSLSLRKKQVHIFTAKVDAKEEASADEGSHYTYSVTAYQRGP